MLLDIFTSLTTPCSPYIRALGYLDEALAMRRRYRRNKTAWQPHLENTRRFVLSTAEKCRDRGKVIILGSGLLLDVPLVEFSGMFREVVLMDVVCLPGVGKRIRRYNNVRFVEHDVTNVAERLCWNSQAGIQELPGFTPASSAWGEDAGLVVSLNVLSQLWVVPRAFACRELPELDSARVDEWCGRIVEAHYAALRSLSCPVCLVADHEFVKRNRGGGIISRASTVYDLALPEPDESWTWNIAPLGRQSPYGSKELIVGAWHLRL